MHYYDKAKMLKDRHIDIVIEWGGTDMFSNVSAMSLGGVVEFLKIMSGNDKEKINDALTKLIQKEYETN